METEAELRAMDGKQGQVVYQLMSDNCLYTEDQYNDFNSKGYFGKRQQRKPFAPTHIETWIWKFGGFSNFGSLHPVVHRTNVTLTIIATGEIVKNQ